MDHVVYYFSGTGNSLSVAKQLEASGATVYAITERILKYNEIVCNADKIGFVFPLNYLGLPKIVHEFFEKLTVKNPSYVYMICTMGATIRGGAIKQVKKYLSQKNCTLRLGCYIHMPSNDFTFASVSPKEKQGVIIEKAKRRLDTILDMVQQSKNHFDREPLKFLVGVRNNPFVASTNSNDNFYRVTDDCIGCGLCEKVCPVSNITMIDQKPVWQHHCETCLACFHYCPKQAITYKDKGKEITRYHHPEVSATESEEYRVSKSL